jgi:hypothetical protein
VSFSELENDTLNQAELNEIKFMKTILNIQGSWTKWKSEATNPYLSLRVYVKMSEIHETGGVWHKI